MRKIIAFIFLNLTTLSFANLQNEIDKDKLRYKRYQEHKKIEKEFRKTENRRNEENLAEKKINFNISNIKVLGNTFLENFEINKIIKKHIGKNKDIYLLIRDLENKYISKGFITTRVNLDIEKSDFIKGNIVLLVSEGKINKIFYNNKEKPLKTFITFPQENNEILNLRNLDQGIDNLADNSTMEIKPSRKNGFSDIYIKRKNKPITVGINYNNLGQKETGLHRVKLFLNLHNIVGLNENLDLSYQTKLQRQFKDRNTSSFSLKYSMPFKYYNLSYSYDYSSYLRTIDSLSRKYKATGNTQNQSFEINRTIYRNDNHKINFGVNLTLKRNKNYIDDVKLVTGSRKLSVLKLSSSYIGRFYGGLLSGEISTSFGLKKFGANIDSREWYREENSPKAQFRKYNFNLSWYKPIEKFYYKLNIGGQYSKDILYSQEKMSIGDDTTVRGFKDESLQGDKAIYFRNEIGYKGLNILEPYIAYDYGRAINNKVLIERNEIIQGLTVGVRGTLGAFESNIAVSKAIDRPHYFKNKKPVVYASLSLRF